MKKQYGFTIVEIFIALSVGLVLLAGVLSIFVGMRTTSTETSDFGELQENGRLAISLLSDDLLRQDFWGDYTGTLERGSLLAVPGAPGNECTGEGLNNGTFPNTAGHFRTLWGVTATSALNLVCIKDAKIGSDVMQLKRVVGRPLVSTDSDNYYFIANFNEGEIFTGTAIPNVENSRIWEYQHHIYYVREKTYAGNVVPTLMQGQLTTRMNFEPIIDGIERVHFTYGVDTNDDGVVNTFLSANSMTDTYWNNGGNSRIIAVKIYVLARSILPDNDYTNNNTYKMGEDFTFTPNDNYRRLLFTSTVTLFNARIDSWPR